MRFLSGLILLAFPIAEIWLLIELFQQYGWLMLFYLMGIGWLGIRMIREEKALFSGRVMQTMFEGGSPIKAIFGGARNIIAGILLLLPGVITDIIAVLLLLVPIKSQTPPTMEFRSTPDQNKPNVNDDVIEGEFRRED